MCVYVGYFALPLAVFAPLSSGTCQIDHVHASLGHILVASVQGILGKSQMDFHCSSATIWLSPLLDY